jgi:hypothetical protein
MSVLAKVSEHQHGLTIAHTRVLLPVAVVERFLDRKYMKAANNLIVSGLLYHILLESFTKTIAHQYRAYL